MRARRMAFPAFRVATPVSTSPREGAIVIRQAISCDICGTEKRQTNHWFVAYEQSGELRVSGWSSRHRGRTGTKHLCGQTCLYKLVGEFIATSIATRNRPAVAEAEVEPAIATAANVTSAEAYDEVESSARLITPAVQTLPKRALHAQTEVVTMPARIHLEDSSLAVDDPSRYSSPGWHAEAWQRERERESRTNESSAGGRFRSLVHRGI
jgi:hypothetical protein